MERQEMDIIRDRLKYVYGEETAGKYILLIGQLIQKYTQTQVTQNITQDFKAFERWNESDIALITYADSIHDNDSPKLSALKHFCDHYLDGLVKIIHLLPFFPWTSDDGFSVVDYREISEGLGEWNDVHFLRKKFDLCFDLVLNHCSKSSQYFINYLKSESNDDLFFVETDPKSDVSSVCRPRSLPLLTKFNTSRGEKYVWTTFSDDQVDFNYSNPNVLLEMLDILLFYAQNGTRVIRLDAIAFLWKELGTSCLHLPKTHEVVKIMRNVMELTFPRTLILTETNVPHPQNISYAQPDEAHLIYNFTLPPLLLHTFYSQSCTAFGDWVSSISSPFLPDGCTYFNFTSSHDGIGVRGLEGLVSSDLVQSEVTKRGGKLSTRRLSDGTDTVYEMNITYFDAFAEPHSQDVPVTNHHMTRFMSSQAIALFLRGIPAVYLPCLWGARNDTKGLERLKYNRAINREKFGLAELQHALSEPSEDPSKAHYSRLFQRYQSLLSTRREQKTLHPDCEQAVLIVPEQSSQILVLMRYGSSQDVNPILCVTNVTENPLPLPIDTLQVQGKRSLLSYLENRSQKHIFSSWMDDKVPTVPNTLQPWETKWIVFHH